jgi:hypothetical protein
MLIRILVFVCCCCCVSVGVLAQSAPNRNFPPDVQKGSAAGDDSKDEHQNSSHLEHLKKMEIKREESNYREHVARAKESAQLAAELREAFGRQKALHETEIRKLARMEKLARQIRSKAGGEESKDEAKSLPPLETAIIRLADLSIELQKKVENTPRQIVSAAIINRANEVIELIKYIRLIYRP